MSLNVKEIASEEFGNCALLTTENFEVLVTLDYGPRIVRAHKTDGQNLIYNDVDPDLSINHGHKMGITVDRSTNRIYCDNSPVRYTPETDGVHFFQTITEPAQLEVAMDIIFSDDKDSFTVEHSVYNKSKDEVKVSIYTETPFRNDGFVFIPQNVIKDPERPSRILTLWEDCKWSDSRLFIGDEFVTVHAETADDGQFVDINKLKPRLKIGVNDTDGIGGYIGDSGIFIKKYVHNRAALYPFYNCSAFATAHEEFLSIQTTSPFYLIASDESARHEEIWKFAENNETIVYNDEAAIEKVMLK